MVNLNRADFIILRLGFVPFIHPNYPRITLTRKKHTPSSSFFEVRDWFDRVLALEQSKYPAHYTLQFYEWNVTSGNVHLFDLGSQRFDRIIVLFGEDLLHWVYYQNTPLYRRIIGSKPLDETFCTCCLQDQYLKILENVKTLTMCQIDEEEQ